MPNYGSSRIISIIRDVVGGVGPTGATGITGATGAYITGPDGSNGLGITGFTYDAPYGGITFYIQGVTAVNLFGFKGNTGQDSLIPAPLISPIGIGVSFLGSSGYTLFFRSITFSAGISASISGQSIVIQNNYGDTGSFDSNEIIFVDFANGIYFLDSSSNAKYKETVYSGLTYANFEVVNRTNRNLFGVDNFNYSTGSSQNAFHYGLTLTIDSAFYGITGTEIDLKSGAWNPYLKYRTNYYDLKGVSGPTSGTIEFLQLGPYTNQISFSNELGSCCYCEECQSSENQISGRKCKDYVLKEYCEEMNGRWSKSTCYQRQNGFDCYRRRACCINGTCINTSQQKCIQMGGIFCPTKECGLDYRCGDQCVQTAAAQGPGSGTTICCCCKNGIPSEGTCADLSTICEKDGGILYTNNCSDVSVDCCNQILGACCKNGVCEDNVSVIECRSLNGLFYGQGSSCKNINCCDPV
jgi:hypothetical protein